MDIHNIVDIVPQPVSLNDIQDFPGPCCMSFGFDLRPLIQSIERVGLINPPLLKKDKAGNITIIVGYRRIRALRALKADSAVCRVLSERDLSPFECLLLNLHDNLSSRGLNDVEKGMALARLATWVPTSKIVEYYMPLLGLPTRLDTFLLYVKVEKELETAAKDTLARGKLSLIAAKRLLEVDQESRSGIFRLMDNIKFNINQQIQLIDYIIDLSYRDRVSIPDILKGGPLADIYTDTNRNSPQKARAILDHLRTRRSPSVVRAEKRFQKMVSDLDLPNGVRISAPAFFEGPDYRLDVVFKEGRELRQRLKGLCRKEGLNRLGDPWEKDD